MTIFKGVSVEFGGFFFFFFFETGHSPLLIRVSKDRRDGLVQRWTCRLAVKYSA